MRCLLNWWRRKRLEYWRKEAARSALALLVMPLEHQPTHRYNVHQYHEYCMRKYSSIKNLLKGS